MLEQVGLPSIQFVSVSEQSAQNSSFQRLHPETQKFRLQLDYHGKCLGSFNSSSVEVVYCDPTQDHIFSYLEDGRLRFARTGDCLVVGGGNPRQGSELKLGVCAEAVRFNLVNNSYLQLSDNQQTIPLCISPFNRTQTTIPIVNPKLNEKVGLTICHENASNINFIEESDFQVRRKALLVPPLESKQEYCDYPACGINKAAPPVKILPPGDVVRCNKMSLCVTVVLKTARRPHLVLRLARSIRSVKGYDLPIIAYDDGVEPHSEEMMRKFLDFPNLQYIIGDKKDLGIAQGRTLAVRLVKTKYFLLFDDDTILNNDTDIEHLVEILDTTDASLVGGKVAGNNHFAGIFLFKGNKRGGRILHHYYGACFHRNETLAEFPDCMRCDTTTNVFLAKTGDVLEVGGWSEELKVREHKDLFLRLKAAQKKVVYCPNFTIYNRKQGSKISDETGFKLLRRGRQSQMSHRFANIWNINLCIELPGRKFILKTADKSNRV